MARIGIVVVQDNINIKSRRRGARCYTKKKKTNRKVMRELAWLDQNTLQGYSSLFSRPKCKKRDNKHARS